MRYTNLNFLKTFVLATLIAVCGSTIIACTFSSESDNSSRIEVPSTGDLTPSGSVPESTSSSAPYQPTVTPLDIPLGSSKGTPSELEAVWEAWALLNRDHIDRESFD